MPPTYHVDGQILDEDYVYGSFKQSKMYHAGVTCSDCHDPLANLTRHFDDNRLCIRRHDGANLILNIIITIRLVGSYCIDCYMPGTCTYG